MKSRPAIEFQVPGCALVLPIFENVKHPLLSEILKDPLLVIDAGGRGGFTILPQFHNFMNVHSFEPDRASLDELRKFCRGNSFASFSLYETALSDSNGEAAFYRTLHPSMSSLLEPDLNRFFQSYNAVRHNREWAESMRVTERTMVKTEMLSSFTQLQNISRIDLLKLDTQGAELKILHGAGQLLNDKKIGLIFTEVLFIPTYVNYPVFSGIDIFLRSKGYRFIDLRIYPEVLDKENSISLSGKLVEKPKYCVGGDAVYIPEFNSSSDKGEIKRVAMLLAGFGYYSDSKTLLKEYCGMNEDEAENFQRTFSEQKSGGRFKKFLKRWTPPAIANFYSRSKR